MDLPRQTATTGTLGSCRGCKESCPRQTLARPFPPPHAARMVYAAQVLLCAFSFSPDPERLPAGGLSQHLPSKEVRSGKMADRPDDVLTDITYLPTDGTPERLEWDNTIRQANELYPDWSSINIGKARFQREIYEQQYKECYEDEESLLCAVAGH
jgi:hypothetical protein